VRFKITRRPLVAQAFRPAFGAVEQP